jgi:hypothetical protein
MLKLKILTSTKSRTAIIEESLASIKEYLIKNPYDYERCIKTLVVISLYLKNMPDAELVDKVADCYSMIIKRNIKAAKNTKIISSLKDLVELSLRYDVQLSKELPNVLLFYGSIKQVYLGLKLYEKSKEGISVIVKDK